MLKHNPTCSVSVAQIISTMVRGIWRNDHNKYKILTSNFDSARTQLTLNPNDVSLIDPNAFCIYVNTHRHAFLNQRIDALNDSLPAQTWSKARKLIKSKFQATWNLAKIWTLQNKRLSLPGFIVHNPVNNNSDIVRDSRSIKQGLSKAWLPVFEEKP